MSFLNFKVPHTGWLLRWLLTVVVVIINSCPFKVSHMGWLLGWLLLLSLLILAPSVLFTFDLSWTIAVGGKG